MRAGSTPLEARGRDRRRDPPPDALDFGRATGSGLRTVDCENRRRARGASLREAEGLSGPPVPASFQVRG